MRPAGCQAAGPSRVYLVAVTNPHGREGRLFRAGFDEDCQVRHLIRDRDGKYPALFDAVLTDAGI